MNRIVLVIAALLVGTGLTWFFPLFRIVPLAEVAAAKAQAKFDAATFVREFWDKQLVPSFEQAHEATEVLTAVKTDPEMARKTYGKSVGIGRVFFYFLRGEGRIVALDKAGVAVSCIAPDDESDMVLRSGLLFGNAIRDATGQLRASDYANSQDFNALSRELNRIAEQEVLPSLTAQAQVGRTIRFVACVEVRESSNKLPLKAIPLEVDIPE